LRRPSIPDISGLTIPQARAAFIDWENINDFIASAKFTPEVAILHIDLDGNDYWIWKAINVISPIVAIMEYNAVFGNDRPITVPYDKTFVTDQGPLQQPLLRRRTFNPRPTLFCYHAALFADTQLR
jgi:hypothetical protein